MADPATLAGPVDGVLITKGSLFSLLSLSLSSLSPSPSPPAPFTGKQGGRARDRATRRGDAFRRETNKAETVRSIENFTSRLHAAGLSHWLPFPSIHPSIEGKGGREMVVGFFPQRLCEVKAALSPLSSYSISNREWSIPTRFFLFFGQFIIECGWIEDLAVKREDSFVTVVELLLLLLLLRYD